MIGESAQATKVYTVGEGVRPEQSCTRFTWIALFSIATASSTLSLPKPSTAGIAITRTAPAPRPGGGQFADNLRRIAETNPTVFAEIVRPQPVFANGVQRGYRVYPGRNRQQFAKLGLQPGDLVLSINGTPLDDPQRGMEIFNTIGTSDRVTVTVERNGQPQELTLNTAQIMLPDGTRRRRAGPASNGRSRARAHARSGITIRKSNNQRLSTTNVKKQPRVAAASGRCKVNHGRASAALSLCQVT